MKDLTKIEIELIPRPDLCNVTQVIATLHVAGNKFHWPALHDGPCLTEEPETFLPTFLDGLRDLVAPRL
jgi:hypothetical protein